MVSAVATAVLALIGGAITLAVKYLSQYLDDAPERKRKQDALAEIELAQTQDAMADVDRVLDGVQPPGQQ